MWNCSENQLSPLTIKFTQVMFTNWWRFWWPSQLLKTYNPIIKTFLSFLWIDFPKYRSFEYLLCTGQWQTKMLHVYTECTIWRTTRSLPGTSHESEASEASVFCFDNASPEKSCFVDGLVCFISLCLLVFAFLNASRRDRDCPTFASTGKQWIYGIRRDEGSE